MTEIILNVLSFPACADRYECACDDKKQIAKKRTKIVVLFGWIRPVSRSGFTASYNVGQIRVIKGLYLSK